MTAGCRQLLQSTPPLPKLDTSRFEASVREKVEQAAKAAEAAPGNPDAVMQFGMVLHAHDQLDAAIVAYRRAIALGSGPDTHYYLGVALASQGKYSDAIEPLEKSGRRLELADALLASGDSRAAQTVYRSLPGVAQAHYGLGRTLSGDAAVAEFVKALELFPRYGAAQFALASAYRRMGRAAEADKVLANYARDKTVVPPLDDPALTKLQSLSAGATALLRQAQILEREGQLPAALSIHERVVATEPKLDQAWVNLISLYGRLGQPEKAEEAFRRAIELAPNRADAYYNFGVLCFAANRFADAGRYFAKALELDPQNAEAADNLGAVLASSGQMPKAVEMFRKAIAIKPDHRLAHFHLGQVYAGNGQLNLAIAELEKTTEPLDDQSPTFIYALGAAHARAGHRPKAISLLERARSEAAARNQQQLTASIDRDLGALRR